MASIYAVPSDNITSTGSPTLQTGAADSGYPLANAYNLRPDKPFKPTSTAAIRITWDWGSARTLGIVSLHNVLIDAGAAVVFQMHSAPITSSTSDITVPIVITAVREDGRRPNAYADLSAQAAKRYAALFVPINSVTISLGEVAIWAAKRTFVRDLLSGMQDPETRPVIEHGTDEDVSTVYDRGVTKRRFSGDLYLSAAQDDDFNSWWRAAKGRVNPVLFILDPAVNDAMLIRLSTVKSHERIKTGLSKTFVEGTELSPGVPV